MPSNRKRIGFLPSEEVHQIIDQISAENNFSQSKVTGILVEEALRSRGVLKNSFKNNSSIQNKNYKYLQDSKDNQIKRILSKDLLAHEPQENKLEEELKMINDYIEFKLFKKVMNQKNNLI